MVEADWLCRNHLRCVAIGFGFLLGISGVARAQENEKVVVLNHADSLVGREINGERVRELIGNVKFTQGSVVVTCSRALQYLAANTVQLEGEVEVRDSSMRMVCSHGMYYGNDRVAEAFERVTVEDRNTTLNADYGKYFVKQRRVYFKGNVTVSDTQSVLRSRELIYDRGDQSADARGDVTITGRRNRMTIFGNHFEDFKQKGYSRMTDHPRLVQIDTASNGAFDTLSVTSGVMESYQDSLGQLVAREQFLYTGRQHHPTAVTVSLVHRRGGAGESGLRRFDLHQAREPEAWDGLCPGERVRDFARRFSLPRPFRPNDGAGDCHEVRQQ
ncbi:MAG: hypothetical protein E6K56_00065 [Ignavibacteria bacterium]|nr:MAG: hypothetical protein E6K56_00065 [Ignavibacteria bacterium]